MNNVATIHDLHFHIPSEWRERIYAWQKTLPHSDGVGWTSRYEFCFREDGISTFLKVKDSISGEEIKLLPDMETL